MMTTHEIKCFKPYFQHILDGVKTFELRYDDRGYEVNDKLILHEFDGRYSGRACKAYVRYKLHGGVFGLEKGYCILGIYKVQQI